MNEPTPLTGLSDLKLGDRLRYSDGAFGEVTEIEYSGVRITWRDGQTTTLLFNSPNPERIKAISREPVQEFWVRASGGRLIHSWVTRTPGRIDGRYRPVCMAKLSMSLDGHHLSSAKYCKKCTAFFARHSALDGQSPTNSPTP